MKKIICLCLGLLLFQLPKVTAESLHAIGANGAVILENQPTKIVVLGFEAYDTLRTLDTTDLIIGAPKKNIPNYIGEMPTHITDIGSIKEPNLEIIASLEPDLIIATGRTADYVKALEEIAPVFQFSIDYKNYWKSFTGLNTELAKLVNKQSEAEIYLKEINQIADKVRQINQASQTKTLALLLNEGEYAALSANGRFALLYQVLNFIPTDAKIEDNRHGSAISFEGILAINPDQIFILDRTQAIGGDTTTSIGLTENKLIQQTKAAQNQHIYNVDAQLWYLAGGGLESTRLQIEDILNLIQ